MNQREAVRLGRGNEIKPQIGEREADPPSFEVAEDTHRIGWRAKVGS